MDLSALIITILLGFSSLWHGGLLFAMSSSSDIKENMASFFVGFVIFVSNLAALLWIVQNSGTLS
jgi:hypothetical protein